MSDEMSRCECCGLPTPYLELKFVRVDLPIRRVGKVIVAEPRRIYRYECADCREAEDD